MEVGCFNFDFSGFGLCEKLAVYDLEEHMEEIVHNIWGDEFSEVLAASCCKEWSVMDVKIWILSLKFLGGKRVEIAQNFHDECIDGVSLPLVFEYGWSERLGLNFESSYMMELIFQGWALGNKTFKIAHELEKPIGNLFAFVNHMTHFKTKVRIIAGVQAGIIADLSECEVTTARQLRDTDSQCSTTGSGYIYGQLVVLGYKVPVLETVAID